MSLRKIKRAIISVSDKSNLKIILPILRKLNVELISSGGTYKEIRKMKYNCTEISNYTGFSEMLEGRIKTLHPKIYAGILNIRNNKRHKKDLKKLNIPNIDLVIVNLYPFEEKLSEKISFNKIVEQIDIGGSALIRAAAKNFNDVTVISNKLDYKKLISELRLNKGRTSFNFRRTMAAKAFNLSAYYDAVIANWLNRVLDIKFPEKKTIYGKLAERLRYGENPHQNAGLYYTNNNFDFKKIHGKQLSYNNYNDTYAALNILKSYKKNEGSVIIKHSNPCGASSEKNQITSFKNSFECDPLSAFGGVVGVNSVVTKKLALELNKIFFEIIVAKGFNKDALKILKRKKNLRLLICKNFNFKENENGLFLKNSILLQDIDNKLIDKSKMRIVTKKKPSNKKMNSLIFAFQVCKYVKSNAIVLVNDKSTIGIGSGQPSRLDSCKISINKALEFLPEKLSGCVAASDAFFPFEDGINELINSGVDAIIQPGGSVNDKKIISEANKAGISMIFTGIRHFKH